MQKTSIHRPAKTGTGETFHGIQLADHRAFWEGRRQDRPLLAINLGFFAHEHLPRTMNALPKGPIRPEDIPIDLFLEDCDWLYSAHGQIGDDYPFVASPIVFIPWMEAIMGCSVCASLTSVWTEPCVNAWATWSWRRPMLEDPWSQKLLDIMRALVEHSKGRYPVSGTMMRGPADMLAAMRGADRFAVDFLDDPETMQKAVDLCTETWIDIGNAQHDLIPDSKDGYMDGDRGFRFWAPQKAIWLQEDAMTLLSPTLFQKFILPADRRIAETFGAVAFHLHDTGLWGLDDLLTVGKIGAIELNYEAAVSDVEATFAGWKKIRAKKPVLLWRLYAEDFEAWLDRVFSEFSPDGLCVQVTVRTVEDGIRVRKMFMEKTRR